MQDKSDLKIQMILFCYRNRKIYDNTPYEMTKKYDTVLEMSW